jgi:uncharacterized membrane protein YphA (DoxX/SURF4 family)
MKKITPELGFWLIVIGLGLLWMRSGFSKIVEGRFVQSLENTILLFANGNPANPQLQAGNPYPWYKAFLLNVAVPNSWLMGLSVQWGEFLVGLGLVALPIVYFLLPQFRRLALPLLAAATFFGLLLNLSLWLASAWTSASTELVGLVMMLIQIVALCVFITMIRSSLEKRENA